MVTCLKCNKLLALETEGYFWCSRANIPVLAAYESDNVDRASRCLEYNDEQEDRHGHQKIRYSKAYY